ncbi:MAG: outer membrane protein assembly factor BamA [Fidelibacterota bacterium]
MKVKGFFIFFSIFFLLISPVLSFSQQAGIKILNLEVTGNVIADAEVIKSASGLYVGKEITAEDIQNAVKRLWNLGSFSDIQIVLEKELANGIYLTIRVKEFPRLKEIQLEGNKKIKKDEISDKLDFYTGQVITPDKIKKAVNKIESMYKEKGYLLVKVKSETFSSEEENKVIVKFIIEEGKKVKVKKINFYGNEHFSDGKLKGEMKNIHERSLLRFWRKSDFDPEKFEEDKESVLNFYQNHGYRDAEVLKDSIYYDGDKKRMFIDIYIREGVKYYFGDITWEGNRLYTVDELNKALRIKRGDEYNKELFEKAIYERVTGLYLDKGYIYIQILPDEIPVAEDTIDVHFNIVENQQVRVRNIVIKGNTKTKEKVIRREIKLMPGDIFSRDALYRSQREIYILNYFSNVIPNIVRVDEDEIDVEFEVEEKQTGKANATAGYSERDGLIGAVGLDFPNFFGGGQQISFNWQFGTIFRSFSISFTEPWLFDTPTLAGFSVFNMRRGGRYYPFDWKEKGGSVRIGRRFNWPDNYFRGNWVFRFARRDIYKIADPQVLKRITPTGQNKTTQVTLMQIITRDSRDMPEFTTKGSVVSLTSQLSGGPLGGTEEFHKHMISVNWFVPTFWKFVLFSSYEFGMISKFSTSSFIPYDELFIMGGGGLTIGIPLRGYNDRSVGPLSKRGLALGGRSMVKVTTELRFPISTNPVIYGLLFAEAGNTWLDLKTTDPFNLRRSVGFGVRLFMPMLGLIGFDVGYGFDDANGDGKPEGWKPHFQFGMGF